MKTKIFAIAKFCCKKEKKDCENTVIHLKRSKVNCNLWVVKYWTLQKWISLEQIQSIWNRFWAVIHFKVRTRHSPNILRHANQLKMKKKMHYYFEIIQSSITSTPHNAFYFSQSINVFDHSLIVSLSWTNHKTSGSVVICDRISYWTLNK